MAKPWQEVVADERFQDLDEQQKENARQQYFNEVVKPNLPEDQVESIRLKFDEDTKYDDLGFQQEKYEERPTSEVAGERLERGVLNLRSAKAFKGASDIAERAGEQRREYGLRPSVAPEEPLVEPARPQFQRSAISARPGEPSDPMGRPLISETGETMSSSKQVQGEAMTREREKIDLLITLSNTTAAESEKIPMAPVAKAAFKAKSFTNAWNTIKQAPMSFIGEVGLTSLPLMAEPLAKGSIGMATLGPIGGMLATGEGSYNVDYAAELRGEMERQGIDVKDVAAVREAMMNPDVFGKIKSNARAHAAVVGIFDGLSMGLASKTLAPKAISNIIARQIVNVPLQTTAQGLMGAAGEGGGQLAAGRDLEWGEILAEAAGEFITAPVDVVVAGVGAKRQQMIKAHDNKIVKAAEELNKAVADRATEREIEARTQEIEELEADRVEMLREAFEEFENSEAAKKYTDEEKAFTEINKGVVEPADLEPVAPTTEGKVKQSLDQQKAERKVTEKPKSAMEAAFEQTKPVKEKKPTTKTSKYTVETEDFGVLDVQIIRNKDGSASIVSEKGTVKLNADFVKGKTDNNILEDQLKAVGFISAKPTKQYGLSIDEAAEEAATSPKNDLPQPTDAQIEAGTYKKGHVKVKGLDVTIENPKGSVREGVDPGGQKWSQKMTAHYGYIKRTQGADNEQVDVFLGPDAETADTFYVINQNNKDGSFDESKVMIGWPNEKAAKAAYMSNYEKGWTGFGSIVPLNEAQFKRYLNSNKSKKALPDSAAILLSRGAKKSKGAAPKSGFVVANIGQDGTIYYGKPNEIHNDLSVRYPHSERGDWQNTGFADSDGKFYTRKEALKEINKGDKKIKPSPNMIGELDAFDYNEQTGLKTKPKKEVADEITTGEKKEPVRSEKTKKQESEAASRTVASPISIPRLTEQPVSDVYGKFGALSSKKDTTKTLKPYGLDALVDNPELVNNLVKKFGYEVKYFSLHEDKDAGVEFNAPKIKKDGYKNGTLWVYDSRVAGEALQDTEYTRQWRITHELGHAITEKLMDSKYGSGRREGRLGQTSTFTRGVKQVEVEIEPLTLKEAQRTVEWEDVAFRVQRILLNEIGVTTDPASFANEYNINISDAAYRVLTGEFANPGENGFVPKGTLPELRSILKMLENTEIKLAKEQGRKPTKGVSLSSTATKETSRGTSQTLLQMRNKSKAGWAEKLPELSRGIHEALSSEATGYDPRAATKSELSKLRKYIQAEGKTPAGAVRALRKLGKSDAPRGLQQAVTGELAVSPMSPTSAWRRTTLSELKTAIKGQIAETPKTNRKASAKGTTAAKVRQAIQHPLNNWTNAPEVIVVEDVTQLPDYLNDHLKSINALDVTDGLFDPNTGKIYMISDKISGAQHAQRILFHEALGHYGLRQTLKGSQINALLEAIARDKEQAVRKIAAQYDLKYANKIDRMQAAEEWLANEAEINPRSTFVQRAISLLMQWLRRIMPNLKLTKTEVAGVIGRMQKSVKHGSALNVIGGRPMASRRSDEGNLAHGPFNIPQETLWRATVRKMQDKYDRLRVVQEMTQAKVDEETNAYLKEELFHGKVEFELERFEDLHVKPLLEAISDSTITLSELDNYLYARHAAERNAHIQEINPAFRDEGLTGSGMTNAEASLILAAAEKEGKTKELKSLAKKVYKINNARIKTLERYGLADPRNLKMWEEKYDNYVPLRGFSEVDLGIATRIGQAFSIKGKESKQALGRRSRANSPAIYSILQMEETLIRGEKNRVGKAFLKFVRNNPSPENWQVIEHPEDVPKKPIYDDRTGEVSYRRDPFFKMADDVMSVKVDGKEIYIKIKDPLLARAMTNVGVEKAGAIVNSLASFNRFLAMVNTSMNPEFVLSNAARDIQTALINMQALEFEVDHILLARQTIRDLPKAARAIYKGTRDIAHGDEWVQMFRKYSESGAKIGFFGLETIDSKRAKLETNMRAMEKDAFGHALRVTKGIKDFIMDVNSSVENAARLAVFKNALDHGVTEQQAAHIAKNLTVNFNRKGEWGTASNALYLFYNASIQGTATLWKASKSKAVQKVLAGIASAAFLLAEMNRYIAGDDEDGENCYDKIPDWVKRRNLIVMIPGGDCMNRFTFPLPYGYNVPHVVGQNISDMIHGKDKQKAAINMAVAMIDSFNPIGSGDSEDLETIVAKMISPTFLDPIVDLSVNENFMGVPIMPEQPTFGVQVPDSQRYWANSASKTAVYAAKKINELTGGTVYEPGAIDISPETMEHWVTFFTGGMGAFISRSIDYPFHIKDKIKYDEDIPLHKVPFVRKFIGERTEYDITTSFYKRSNEIRQVVGAHKKMLKEATTDKDDNLIDKYEEKHGEMLDLGGELKRASKRLKSIRKEIDSIKADEEMDEAERRKELRELTKYRDEVMTEFNQSYNEVKAQR